MMNRLKKICAGILASILLAVNAFAGSISTYAFGFALFPIVEKRTFKLGSEEKVPVELYFEARNRCPLAVILKDLTLYWEVKGIDKANASVKKSGTIDLNKVNVPLTTEFRVLGSSTLTRRTGEANGPQATVQLGKGDYKYTLQVRNPADNNNVLINSETVFRVIN